MASNLLDRSEGNPIHQEYLGIRKRTIMPYTTRKTKLIYDIRFWVIIASSIYLVLAAIGIIQ